MFQKKPAMKLHSKELPNHNNETDVGITTHKKRYISPEEKLQTSNQGDDCTTGCLLDYTYFKKYYKMIVIDLRKQQALDAYPKVIQQINFTANLDWAGNTRFYLIL